MKPEELELFLQRTDKITGKNWLQKTTSTAEDIARYYTKTRYFFQKFHSAEGAMHFPIKEHPKQSHAEGLAFPVQVVSSEIQKHDYRKVVELGCGVGYNLLMLAQQHPDIAFKGIDLTPKNIRIAKSKAAKLGLNNLHFLLANYDEIDAEMLDEPDFIFDIESLSHSADFDRIIRVCAQALKSNGGLLLFDGYGLVSTREEVEEKYNRAGDYFSRGFFLPNPQNLKASLQSLTNHGFEMPEVIDYTEKILPNFVAFEKGVETIFRYPRLTRLLLQTRIFSMTWFRHTLAGLYGPFLMANGYAGYYKISTTKL